MRRPKNETHTAARKEETKEDSTFTLPELSYELEKVWIDLRKEQANREQLAEAVHASVGLLSLSIVLVCVSLFIMQATMKKIKENTHDE